MPGRQLLHLRLVHVNADDFVAEVGQGGRVHRTQVPASDHRNPHRDPHLVVSSGFDISAWRRAAIGFMLRSMRSCRVLCTRSALGTSRSTTGWSSPVLMSTSPLPNIDCNAPLRTVMS